MVVSVTGGNQAQSVSRPHEGLPQGMRCECGAMEDKTEREKPPQLDRGEQMAALLEQLHHLLGDESITAKVSALSVTAVLHCLLLAEA